MSGRTRKSNRYIKRAMSQSAWAASHTKNTYLAAFYRRMMVRKGKPKAVIALAHHMLTVVYQVLGRGEEYVEMGGDYYDRRNKPKTVARLVERLARLGYNVRLKPIPAEPSGESTPEFDPAAQTQAPVAETEDVPVPAADAAVTGPRRRGLP